MVYTYSTLFPLVRTIQTLKTQDYANMYHSWLLHSGSGEHGYSTWNGLKPEATRRVPWSGKVSLNIIFWIVAILSQCYTYATVWSPFSLHWTYWSHFRIVWHTLCLYFALQNVFLTMLTLLSTMPDYNYSYHILQSQVERLWWWWQLQAQ